MRVSRRITHNPEQPPLHVKDRDHITGVLDHVRHEERRNTEGVVEVRAQQADRPEESLHRDESNISLPNNISTCCAERFGSAVHTNRWKVQNAPAERSRLVMK